MRMTFERPLQIVRGYVELYTDGNYLHNQIIPKQAWVKHLV